MTATVRAPSAVGRFDELLGRPVSMRSLALLRVLVDPIVLLHLWPFLSGPIYSDAFYEPYADWYPELPRGLYVALLWLAAVAAVFMALGLLTRLATATTFAIVAYNLFLSTTHFHNNRAYLVIVLAVLAVAPCGRELSVDAWLRRRRGLPALDVRAPGWPLWLLRFECSIVYGASGVSKLLDPDWFGGTVPWMRVVQARDELPGWAVSLLTNRDLYTGAAKVVVLTELFIACGLWSRRTRYAAVWVAVIFHVSIQLSANVQIFSVRDRVVFVDEQWRGYVRALDWLARFRVEPGGFAVTDRDGTALRGTPARVLLLSRVPVTAWFALPALLLPSVRRARRA